MLLTGLPIGDGTPPVFDSDFLENIFEVELHRIQTDLEDDGNFPIGLAGCDPAENFFFAFAQQGGRLRRSFGFPCRSAPHVT